MASWHRYECKAIGIIWNRIINQTKLSPITKQTIIPRYNQVRTHQKKKNIETQPFRKKRPVFYQKRICVIVRKSLLNGLNEKRIWKKRPVKIRYFSGAQIKDMYHYIIPIVEKKPTHLIFHVGVNDASQFSYQKEVSMICSNKTRLQIN